MKARYMACLLLVGLSMFSLSLCISCKRAESSIPIGEREHPDMELHNADYTLGENVAGASSENPLYMHAALISIYSTGRDTVLSEVSFHQGQSMSGRCKSASVSADNDKATLSGDVFVEMDNDGTKVTIESQEIEWDGKENTLFCNGEVVVTYGDGTKIHAELFSADMDENRYEFGRILEGTLV